MRFYQDDIAIVSYSSVTPAHRTEDELFQGLLQKECIIQDLTVDEEKADIQISHHLSQDQKVQDSSYCKFASRFSWERIEEWQERHQLSKRDSTSLEAILHELTTNLAQKLPFDISSKKTECVVGMGTGEPGATRLIAKQLYYKLEKELDLSADEKERIGYYLRGLIDNPPIDHFELQYLFFTLAFSSLREKYNISGPCTFVDAACASSLAAINVAVARLRSKECDLVVTGGVDLGLAPLTLIAFSKVQVLSKGIMNPFDQSADGMNQGEAGALFALMRLPDAIEAGAKIHAVVRGIDGSSDGARGGLVEPTEKGQALAYERAYENVPMQEVSFLECHGTGTVVGDKTEMASIRKYFHPLPKLGSIKANIGHTISAAGAMSLVKSLKIIEQRQIPPMPHLKNPIEGAEEHFTTENVAVEESEQMRIGVSSFGFGGTNFHMVVDEYRNEGCAEGDKKVRNTPFKFLLNGKSQVDLNFVNELLSSSRIKIPPVSLPYFDAAILGGSLAVDLMFKEMNLKLDAKARQNIGVISTSNFFLDRFIECHEKLAHLEIYKRLDSNRSGRVKELLGEKINSYLPISEDTFPGALANLIAGRVTKDFDLMGPNFNVSGEKSSMVYALDYAKSLLQSRSGAFLVLGMEENPMLEANRLSRPSLQAWMVSDLDFALQANLPIEKEIEQISHFERQYAKRSVEPRPAEL